MPRDDAIEDIDQKVLCGRRSAMLARLAKGAAPNGVGGSVRTGVASQVLRMSAGSRRVQLSAAELEERRLRGPYMPVTVCTSRSPSLFHRVRPAEAKMIIAGHYEWESRLRRRLIA